MRDKDNELVVVKANKFIQQYKYTLSKTEMRVVNAIISNINSPKYDEKLNTMEFDINEFCKYLGYGTGGENHKRLKIILKGLSDKSSDYIDFGDYETIVRWIEKPKFEKNSSKVMLKLDDDLKPFLLQASGSMYAKLNYYFEMDSKYSMRLYELMKSWDGIGKCSYEPNELRACIDAMKKTYENTAAFRRSVLDPAIEEINSITDLIVSYDTVTRGRKVTQFIFTIQKKADLVEVGSSEIKEPEQLPGQMNIDDVIDAPAESEEVSIREKRLAESVRPFIRIGANRMKDEEICVIYSEVIGRLGAELLNYDAFEKEQIVCGILKELSGRMIGKEIKNYSSYLYKIICEHDWESERKKLAAQSQRDDILARNEEAERRDEDELNRRLEEWRRNREKVNNGIYNWLEE